MSTFLVTGGAGYIGSHTVVVLAEAGHNVVVVDNFDNSSPRALAAVRAVAAQPFEFVEGDVRDRALLDRVFADYRIDGVVHFAAMKAVGESVAEPLRYYDNNLGSTIGLLSSMEAAGVRQLVFSSSCTVYGEPAHVPVDESAPRYAVNPYGRTKLVSEDIMRDVAATGDGWQISLLRYFNPVGAHESGEIGEDPRGIPNNLMPYIMQVAVGRLEKLRVFGGDYPTRDGTCIRDYIHVVDLAEGHLAALKALDRTPTGCHAYNLGTGTGTTVLEMVAAASRAVGRELPYEIVERRPGDAMAVYADPAYANTELQWKATRSVDDMCRDHWRWQSAHPSGFVE